MPKLCIRAEYLKIPIQQIVEKLEKTLCSQHDFSEMATKAECSESIFQKSAWKVFFVKVKNGHL